MSNYTPEQKRAYYQQPEQRAKALAYANRPDVQARRKARLQQPEVRARRNAWMREYSKRPEVKDRRRVYEAAYHQQPEHKSRQHRYNIKAKYGLTAEAHAELVVAQEARCAICRRFFPRLGVDHDHTTGEVRGLLCAKCNLLIGYADDDPELLEAAIKYLRRG